MPADPLPQWARDVSASYESHAANQFVLYGNVNDLLPVTRKNGAAAAAAQLGTLEEFLLDALLPSFDVVLTYDLGNGLRVARGQKQFSAWPSAPGQGAAMPRAPREAIDLLTHFARFVANVRRMQGDGAAALKVAFILRDAHLAIPAAATGLNYDLSAMALLVRNWAAESSLTDHPFASFLITENLHDLHPLIVNDARSANIKLPLPSAESLAAVLELLEPQHPVALGNYKGRCEAPAAQLAGATLVSIRSLLRTREHAKLPITDADLAALKKQLVEKDCGGLIEFIDPKRTLNDLEGQEPVKEWIRQDIALWKQGDTAAMPMGYLICGPVGTGKTYMVECIAGEAGVPVVKLKNFRDRWVGSTESNLEKIFRLLQALGRCYVFIDEADQTLGKRNTDGDSGVGGRVYSMMAQEMSNTANRGRIVWILASSRPDLIEVDLKRPGRVDVKIPLFPTTTPEDGFKLLRALCRRKGCEVTEKAFETLRDRVPHWLTPGAAETLAVKSYRQMKTKSLSPDDALTSSLADYQPPIPKEVMEFQIGLAVSEASDLSFVPESLRHLRASVT